MCVFWQEQNNNGNLRVSVRVTPSNRDPLCLRAIQRGCHMTPTIACTACRDRTGCALPN
jgi:hypothetical protein